MHYTKQCDFLNPGHGRGKGATQICSAEPPTGTSTGPLQCESDFHISDKGARMPVIQFKGKTAIESYHHTVPHHTLEFDPKLAVLPKGERPSLDGNLIIEGGNLLALKALLRTHAGRVKCTYIDHLTVLGHRRRIVSLPPRPRTSHLKVGKASSCYQC